MDRAEGAYCQHLRLLYQQNFTNRKREITLVIPFLNTFHRHLIDVCNAVKGLALRHGVINET